MSIDEETMVAPKIIKKLPKVVRTKTGEITTLEAQAIGEPKPVTKWRQSSIEIIPSEDYHIDNYPDGTSVLTINNLPSETVDKITFEAVSPLGVAETVTELHVEGILENMQTPKMLIIFLSLKIRFDHFGNAINSLFSAFIYENGSQFIFQYSNLFLSFPIFCPYFCTLYTLYY